MNYSDFKNSLQNDSPPSDISVLLKALWYDANGDWEAAHNIAQSKEGTKEYDRLHAYLHRVEGDDWNANYWYRRAGTSMSKENLQNEWDQLVRTLTN